MFTKILNSMLKTESSDNAEVIGAKSDRNPSVTLVTKDCMQSSRQCKLSEKFEQLSPDDKVSTCDMALSTQDQQSSSDEIQQKFPIFNGEFEIIKNLGSGNTAKVYLGRSVNDPSKLIAIKMMKTSYLKRSSRIMKNIEQEIQILSTMENKNIVKLIDYGTDGIIVKHSGKVIKDIVFINMEYVDGGLMFNLCQDLGGMGEDAGRFFIHQLIGVMDYMNNKNVVHLDIKIENILLDKKQNIKLADYGFATSKNIDCLKTYRGTKSYMAPEIKKGHVYDGRQSDIFSAGVVLFIIVRGIFPFKEARKDEYFYNLIMTGQFDKYFTKIKGDSLSDEFKDLIVKMLAYHGKDRPTIEDIKNHPWFTKAYDSEMTRDVLIKKRQQFAEGQKCEFINK